MYKNKKIVATVEARMTSSRLSGKVMLDLVGKPVLRHIVERLRRSKYVDEVVVATTINETDDKIINLCTEMGCKYYRGSEEDVLSRVLDAAKSVESDIIVEITGDCPVIDWRHVDHMVEMYFEGEYDYVANDLKPSFPVGLGVQVFSVKTLDEVNKTTKSPVDREHVSLYIYTHPEKYKLGNWFANEEMNYPHFEVTLDAPEDYELIRLIYENLYNKNKDFSSYDVVRLMIEDKELSSMVKNVKRKNPFEEKELWEKENEQ